MNRTIRTLTILTALAVLAAIARPSASHAGFADGLKKKLAEKAAQKTDKAADQAIDKAEKGPSKSTNAPAAGNQGTAGAVPAGAASGAATATPAGGSGVAATKVSAVNTKFDYVPGDKVILADDFTEDDLGEFPAHWKLAQGNFEVAEMDGERWMRCMSADGLVRIKTPAAWKTLPEYWTLEFDFYATEPMEMALSVRAINPTSGYTWEIQFPAGKDFVFRSGSIFSSTPFEGDLPGRHHVMLMARQTSVKAYIDQQRYANTPDVSEATGGMPDVLEFRLWASTHPMITNVRFAEGCVPAKEALDSGRLVTYGIRFATGSDVVLPESAPVLRQVASYMTAHPDVALAITGHTDNVGSAASNLDLSKRRAVSVAKVLGDEFGVAGNRFTTDGKGDTAPVAKNATAEGRAMNRRVEFAKTGSTAANTK